MRHLRLVLSTCVVLAACSSDDTHSRPDRPAQNDPAFTVTGAPRYLLVADELTPATTSFTVKVTAPDGVDAIDAWLDDGEPLALSKNGSEFTATVDATTLAPGLHGLLLAERGADAGFFAADFAKGAALYVIISTDWDFSSVDERMFDIHDELHERHPALKITHLIGPYTFTDPMVDETKRTAVADFAKRMQSEYGDEIGLHIHPWCHFVTAAGLTCKTMPSTTMPQGDPSGYTIRLGAYTRDEFNVLLDKADELFAARGMGKPTSFRAGGWTLDLSTALALDDSGYVADSSALNWKYMTEEWPNSHLLEWNSMQWAGIDDTSQPYHPTETDIRGDDGGTAIRLLEIPDNAIMVDYVSVAEMTNVFQANWNGQALATPVQVSTGFHPVANFGNDELGRLHGFFDYVDGFLAKDNAGPAVYINMSDAAKIW